MQLGYGNTVKNTPVLIDIFLRSFIRTTVKE